MTNEEVIERLGYIKQQYNILLSTDIYDEVIDTAIKALKDNARSQGAWISVSERLPIRNGCYNVTRIIEGTAISDVCYFDGQNTWHRDVCVNHGRPYLTDITAWRPLPEPYNGGGAE